MRPQLAAHREVVEEQYGSPFGHVDDGRHLATKILERFAEPGAYAYVFTSAEGNPIEPSNFRDRVWVPATKASGLEGRRFHDLRHTACTLAARTGATTKELMAQLGHASMQAAMTYQHAAADRDRVIADGLADMLIEILSAGTRPSSDQL